MKLYYAPGACSLSPRIVLREAGISFDSEAVDLRAKKTKGGADFYAINPKGYVPALVLDDGELLTEAAIMVQYIADHTPSAKLAPPPGTKERLRFQEWMNFIATELHKGFSPLFNPKIGEEMKASLIDRLKGRFGMIAKEIDGKKYLTGDNFTVADAYLFTMLTWAKNMGIETGPILGAYYDRVRARPAVGTAIADEGLKL